MNNKKVVVVAKYHVSDCNGQHAFTDTKAKEFNHDSPIGDIMDWIKSTNSQTFEIVNLD